MALVALGRPDLRLTPAETDRSLDAVEVFSTALGGRDALLQALSFGNGSPEVDRVTQLLEDPRYRSWSLRRICDQAQITIADLFDAYKKALLTMAHLQATQTITRELVEVVADVMKRAHPYEMPCSSCRGLGRVTPDPTTDTPNPPPTVCETCQGSGHTIELPDLDRQKLALELGQLVVKGGGINLQQNALVVPPPATFGPGAIDQLQQAVAEVLTPRGRRPPAGPAPVVDVEPAQVDA